MSNSGQFEVKERTIGKVIYLALASLAAEVEGLAGAGPKLPLLTAAL